MKLYMCADGSYAGTQADAKAKGKGWMHEEVPTDKAGLIDYLNKNRHLHELQCPDPARHLDETVQAAANKFMAPSYTDKSVSFEAEFDAMPLATQLHYAARAMENARDAL